jgi:hypothetical protein
MASALAASACFASKGAALRAPTRKATVARSTTMSMTGNARVNRFHKTDIIVSPSILSANFATLGADVRHRLPTHNPRRSTATKPPDCNCAMGYGYPTASPHQRNDAVHRTSTRGCVDVFARGRQCSACSEVILIGIAPLNPSRVFAGLEVELN